MQRNYLLLLTIGCALLLTGCADKVPLAEAAAHSVVGFWYGWWHGLIVPFAWLVSLFDADTAIYAVYNNGGWYDFGYLIGIGALSVAGRSRR